MGGAEDIAQVIVVAAVLVGIADDEADGRACAPSFEDAGEELHAVALLARRGQTALPWLAPVELGLDEVEVQLNACGTAVHDAADGSAMALAKGCQTEKGAEGVHEG